MTEQQSELYTYPSRLVNVTFKSRNNDGVSGFVVRMPEGEVFRVKSIFQDQEYKLARFRGPLRPRTIVDIGANVGLFALYMKMVDPDAVIHCFEPVPSTVALLAENVGGLAGVHIHPYALTKDPGQDTIYLHGSNTGQNSLKRIEPNGQYAGSTTVPCRCAAQEIDALRLGRIDVLKIDTEGCEVEILESLGDRLEITDYVLLEFHSEEDRRRLDGLLRNFLLYGGKAGAIGRGTFKYVHQRLVASQAIDQRCP